jgi:hypothetical protein
MSGCCIGCKHWECDKEYPAQWVRENEKHLGGQCTLNPTWVEVRDDHHCSHFVGKYQRAPSYQDAVWGRWEARALQAAEEANKKLRQQLDTARKISAGRLARLKRRDA